MEPHYWPFNLSDQSSLQAFGPRHAGILQALRQNKTVEALRIFLEAWKEVPWRMNEGNPHSQDHLVTRIHRYDEAPSTTSEVWIQALKRAGIRSEDPLIESAWESAGKIGAEVGSHNAKLLASAMAGELVQLSSDFKPFFLPLFHWVLAGHAPCGWDDKHGRVIIF